MSCLSAHFSGMIEDGLFTLINVPWIERVRSGPGNIPGYHVELSIYSFITTLLSGLHGLHGQVPENSRPSFLDICVGPGIYSLCGTSSAG